MTLNRDPRVQTQYLVKWQTQPQISTHKQLLTLSCNSVVKNTKSSGEYGTFLQESENCEKVCKIFEIHRSYDLESLYFFSRNSLGLLEEFRSVGKAVDFFFQVFLNYLLCITLLLSSCKKPCYTLYIKFGFNLNYVSTQVHISYSNTIHIICFGSMTF